MASRELLERLSEYERYLDERGPDEKVAAALVDAGRVAVQREHDLDAGFRATALAKGACEDVIRKGTGADVMALESYCAAKDVTYGILNTYYDALLVEAPYIVDSFMRYIELGERDPLKRFYAPRAERLRPVIDAYQMVYDGKLDFLSVSQPKRTGKTTAGLRLCLMMGGRRPTGAIFATGRGESLVKRFYGGLDEAFRDPETLTRFLDVFPRSRKTGQSAENLSINLKGGNGVYPTFTCRPIDGAIVGSTEANTLVYIDDCVKNHEESRNRERLEFLCEKVTDDVLGRRIEGTPIIIQGTKYSVYDPISALQGKAELLGWRWREVAIPALDPVTDESNWEITVEGGRRIFTTDYFRKERLLVTEETWEAEFQQNPFEAKGRMFPKDRLNYYERLPVDREPDAVMAACDTATGKGDYCSMVIGYIYGKDVFVEDVVYDSSGTERTIPECAAALVRHNVKTVTFESNASGGLFGRDVVEMAIGMGGRVSAKYKYNTANKITRMENAQLNIFNYYYFRAEGTYDRGGQYDQFMRCVTTMTRTGKVRHDDAPDSLALFENEMRSAPAKVEAAANPFRRGWP